MQYQGASSELSSDVPSLDEIHSKMGNPQTGQQGNDEPHQSNNSDSSDDDRRIKFEDWGFNIDRLFEVAYRFYKRNESKAFHPSFDERNQMNALIMQARYGNHDSGKAPDIGALDLVGRRRQYEWSLLKGMSRTEAMTKFICTLDDLCPFFKAHAEAVKISSGSNLVQRLSDQTELNSNGQSSQNQGPKMSETSAQLQSIHSSLCKQTYSQFKSYAEKQHPGDPAQQKYLIASLQEQYYQQYISQMHPDLKGSLPNSSQTSNQSSNIPSTMPSPAASELSTTNEANSSENSLAKGHVAQVAPPVKQNSEPLSTSSNTNNESGELNSIQEESERVIEAQDMEADISCEELNSEIPPEFQDKSESSKKKSSSIVQQSVISNKDSSTPQGSLVEPVKLYQHAEMPPIGMFESFPQPKLIQKATQRSTPIDQINPNLPSLPPLLPGIKHEAQVEEEIRQESDIQPQVIGMSKHTEIRMESPSNPPPVPQNTTFMSMAMHNQTMHDDQSHSMANPQPTSGHFYEVDAHNAILESHDSCDHPSQELGQDLPEPWGPDDATSSQLSPLIYGPLEPATIWTKGAVAEFKESLSGDKQGGVYEVKESALVVIQVPTYPDGKYIYWEFATDDYDIGFGLDFVYEKNLAQPLALNIYEDNDDDDLEDLIDGDGWIQDDKPDQDPECGQGRGENHSPLNERDKLISEKRRRLANTVSILPTYRRDSHEEVFVGRHQYPNRGYYLLRFDNTYSVLRSKTLYFRICYFM